MMLPVRAMLVLALALVTAPVQSQDAEECPNLKRKLSREEISQKLQAHLEWFGKGGMGDRAVPGRAVLCNADLFRANFSLDGAFLSGANLEGADLREVSLKGADLWGANLKRGAMVEFGG